MHDRKDCAFPILAVLFAACLAIVVFWPSAAAMAANQSDRRDPGQWALDSVTLRLAFPEADQFGGLEGEPPAVPAYKGGKLAGYVFSTRQVVQSTGYSAKPLDIAVGLGLDGIVTGAVIVEQHEPVLVIGVSEADLSAFVEQYRGMDIRQPFRVKRWAGRSENSVDAVSGATISSVVMNDAILRSARGVAASRGLLGSLQSGLDTQSFTPTAWSGLLADDSVQRRKIRVGEAVQAMADSGGALFAPGVPEPDADESFLEIFLALATPPQIGRNLLGERDYNRLMAELSAGDQLIFVAGQGLYSFKGHRYRKTGEFDRIQVIQGARTFKLKRENHEGREALKAQGAPDLREIALFVLRQKDGFDPLKPWRLQLLVSGQPQDGVESFAVFDAAYRLPARYLKESPAGLTGFQTTPLWLENWWQRRIEIALLAAGLITLSLILFFQDAIAKRKGLYHPLRIGFLIYTLVWIGWLAGAQLSVINVLTFADSLIHDFRWDFFLLEPLIFILWGYTAVAMMFWGRGVFCGWLCPFGAAQELVARLARLARVPQWRLPFPLHERLWPIKYIAFIALFALFLYDADLALRGAEIEPFKTAIVLKFDRAWPYLLYVVAILVSGLFVTRVYCRYLCPLGAALALPARLRMFEWLRRRWQCGKPCQNCAVACPVQAIHPEGRINPNECIHCLNCQVNYYDDSLCPVLVDRKRRRARAKGKESQPAAGPA